MPKFLCQNWQSAAPPAIVPSMYGLISIIFFTDCDAAKIRKEDNENKQAMHPKSKRSPYFMVQSFDQMSLV